MLGQTSQQIVEIPQIQIQEIIQEIPEIQIRRRDAWRKDGPPRCRKLQHSPVEGLPRVSATLVYSLVL